MNIDYSDSHRFRASLGLGLITLSGVIPWLFLKETFDLQLSIETLEKLSPLAKEIILNRTTLIKTIIAILPWISVPMFFIGLYILLRGYLKWSENQQVIDETGRLTLADLKNKLQEKENDVNTKNQVAASPTEERKRALKDDSEDKETKSSDVKQENALKGIAFKDSATASMRKAFEIEDKIIKSLLQQMPILTHELLINKRLERREYDAILASKEKTEKDIIFEFKYRTSKSTRLQEIVNQVSSAIFDYEKTTGRQASGNVVIVVSNDELKTHYRNEVNNMFASSPMTTKNLKYFVITEDEISKTNFLKTDYFN
ncbi:hypothetical protein [Bdellovibrio sp. NC01]|uniref:hypothetical protein n=1 Tax=Bdellovibrio sp. NC01 TaxID=2220073 RepID=UPI00115C3A3F|nr:hypothetical protein [Bdellovibrio sp. NC01]QDK37943.1 hypothetical protein DOE51_10270 [Bdellovibrio sp. NC01]